MQVTLIGPPYSGKTTLFQAIAEAGGSKVDVSRADQRHLAVVKVPDERVRWLTERYKSAKTVPAELTFLDLPGLDLSDQTARAHWRSNWTAVRDSDLIVMVVRSFTSPSVPAYRSRLDAISDAEELLAEMLLTDMEQVANRIVRLEAQLKKPADRQETQRELDLMKRLGEALENEKPIRDVVKSQAEEKAVKSFAFLSLKPHVVVLNCDENEADLPTDPIAGATALRLSAKIEEEMAQLSEADRAEFLGELNLAALARDRLIQACYRKLNLISMFTVDYRECRAWPLPAGTDSLTAADQIHSDIARGFIRGEIMAYEDVFAAGGDEKAVKAAGKFRLEGKQYVIKDGDIVHFRFNI